MDMGALTRLEGKGEGVDRLALTRATMREGGKLLGDQFRPYRVWDRVRLLHSQPLPSSGRPPLLYMLSDSLEMADDLPPLFSFVLIISSCLAPRLS